MFRVDRRRLNFGSFSSRRPGPSLIRYPYRSERVSIRQSITAFGLDGRHRAWDWRLVGTFLCFTSDVLGSLVFRVTDRYLPLVPELLRRA